MSDLITNNDALRSGSPLLCTNILSSPSRGPDMTFYILTAGYPFLLGCDSVSLGKWFPTFRPVLYYHHRRRHHHHHQQQHNDEKLWFRSNETCSLDLENALGHFLFVLISLSWLARSPVEKRAEKSLRGIPDPRSELCKCSPTCLFWGFKLPVPPLDCSHRLWRDIERTRFSHYRAVT
jgi:hypothetical protein